MSEFVDRLVATSRRNPKAPPRIRPAISPDVVPELLRLPEGGPGKSSPPTARREGARPALSPESAAGGASARVSSPPKKDEAAPIRQERNGVAASSEAHDAEPSERPVEEDGRPGRVHDETNEGEEAGRPGSQHGSRPGPFPASGRPPSGEGEMPPTPEDEEGAPPPRAAEGQEPGASFERVRTMEETAQVHSLAQAAVGGQTGEAELVSARQGRKALGAIPQRGPGPAGREGVGGAANQEPVVTINIGRIEVRAVSPEKPKDEPRGPAVSLEEYRKIRKEGGS
jgi:hypothetical protein